MVPTSISRPHLGATGLICKNAEDVCQVAGAGEQEEEHADALCAFPAVVEQQLRNAGAEVKSCAEVSKDLAGGVEGDALVFG